MAKKFIKKTKKKTFYKKFKRVNKITRNKNNPINSYDIIGRGNIPSCLNARIRWSNNLPGTVMTNAAPYSATLVHVNVAHEPVIG